ncbi:hypothetical protein [Streptosporangium sp. KLBMP 9127]|nr:hypothetical protein [Streptosporangium sp. KLBMP 9127]
MDGSYLTVTPLTCTDSVGVPYEVVLELRRDGTPYGMVGERCGWVLARLALGVAAARAEQGGCWVDPDDRFPGEGPETELFAFRCRERADVAGGGELRCLLRTRPIWIQARDRPAPGEWRLTRRAIVEAWGAGGLGLRAVLTSAQLGEFLGELVTEVERCLGEGCGEPVRERGRNPVEGAGTSRRR